MRARLWTGLLTTWLLAAPVWATPERSTERQQELGVLRERIEQLKREVEQAANERNEAADALQDSERNISSVQRSLRELDFKTRTLQREQQRLARRVELAQAQIEEQQERMAILVRQRYRQGGNDVARLMLGGENPASVARQLGYAGYVARARADLIARHEQGLQQLRSLQQKVVDNRKRLAQVRDSQVAEKTQLERERTSRQAVLARLSEQIRKQRKEINVLVRDEQRLSRLVQRLAELKAQRERAAARKREPGQRVDRVVDSRLADLDFTKLRGRLALPLAGELLARFGSPRDGGGPVWKGLFIQADTGQSVRSVGSGQVVFADWLRGFGNLIIVDHGEAYLSLYSNNESLYKQPGDAVRAGDVIASVGNTGGHENPGLYFELRHKGKPFDPLTWTGGRLKR